jgi:hypothetical protein
VNFQKITIRPIITLAVLFTIGALAFAGCGGGYGSSTAPGVNSNCQQYGGGSGGGANNCAASASPTPDPNAQSVSMLLTGEKAVAVAPYGDVTGYSTSANPGTPNGSNIINLTANMPVQFANREASNGLAHTASSLGSFNGSFPTSDGLSSAALTPSAAGTSLGASGFTTGNLNPGQVSAVYTSGGPAMIMLGCYWDYPKTPSMRTVVIVQ